MNNKEWTDHFTGTFRNPDTGKIFLVTLQAVVTAGALTIDSLLQGLDSSGSNFKTPYTIDDGT